MSQDEVKTKASPRTPRTPPTPDEVRTKISGSGPDRDKAPESVAPDSVQATADASGARLLIPALSLREAIANIDSAQDPVASLAAERESQELGLAQRVGEPTETVQKPRRWYKSSLAVWLTAGVLVGLGFLASTTEAAESVAGRIYTMFQNEEAIPAAAADMTPSAEMPATTPVVANVNAAAAAPEPATPAAQVPAVTPAAKAPAKVAPKGPQPLRTRPVTR